MGFEITDEPVDDVTHVVAPRGELDMAVAGELKARLVELIDSGKRFVVVDLEHVGFLDSTALAVLLSTQRRAQGAGGRLTLACDDRNLCQVFEITRLDSVLGLHASRALALAALGARRPDEHFRVHRRRF